MRRFMGLGLLIGLLVCAATLLSQEAGHAPNRAYTSQSGNFYLNGAAFYNSDTTPSDISAQLNVLDSLSTTELGYIDGVTAGTATASKALVVDANKDVGDCRNFDALNVDAGASGTAGSYDVFPSTASKGKLSITAADSAGDTTTTIVNASQAGARTYTIPDAGASASFVMAAGAQTVGGAKTLTEGAATPAVALRLGATATEGLEVKVYDETIELTNAVSTDTTCVIPAGAVILSAQVNLEAAITGDASGDDLLATVGLGISGGDEDGYGETSALTQNAKIASVSPALTAQSGIVSIFAFCVSADVSP